MTSNINFMITAKKLNELIKKKENIIIIDVRDIEEYLNGHIINAVNFPEIFTYLPEGITTEEEKEDFISFYKDLFSKAGVCSSDTVVFYENKFTLMSPRGLLILKYLGHDEEKIKVLDGGYDTWCQNNFETTFEFVENKPKDFIPNINENFFVDYNEMREIIKDDSIVKLDVRDKDEWIGISSSPYGINFAPKKGRIPNSVWIEWYDFITEDMLSVASLDKIQIELDKKAIKEDDNIVLYCFKGARIANSYIALRKLGYKNIRIYFAGWNEWCRKDEAPFINEVESNDNPILQENILLKNKLDELNLKQTNLIDFPKYNKQAIFAFTREGELCSANEAKRERLPHILRIQDIISDFRKKDIYNMIDNNQEKNITISVEDRYYSLQLRGSRDSNKILVYSFDISKNIKNEKLLFEQSKMVAIGEMIGNITHQWKQPLSAITTAATGARLQKEMEYLSDDLLDFALVSINDHAQYLSQTIDDFRGFLNPKNNIEKEFYIKDTFNKTLNLLRAEFAAIDIEIIENIENFKLVSIENELVQSLMNIFKNAKDVLAKLENKKGFIFIDTYTKDDYFIIEIKDNGNGIPEDIIARIFEPYFTTKHKSQGTGLGLYMSAEIIRVHLNGTLSVENSSFTYEGSNYIGAKFTIKIVM